MELKAKLDKPYTETQRADFIVENNHNLGYEIRETENTLEAWGKTEEESFEINKVAKFSEIKREFEKAENNAYLMSELGFPIDANDRSNRDVTGLVKKLESEPEGTLVDFCDYNNEFHKVDLEDCNQMLLEIVENGQYLYEQKWTYRNRIEKATKNEDLEFEIEFKYLNVDN